MLILFKPISLIITTFFILISIYIQQNLDYVQTNLNHWACNIGRRQSPIALRANNSTQTNEFDIIYDNYKSFENVVLTFKDNLLEISDKENLLNGGQDKGYVTFSYQGYLYKFDLEKIVIHLPAEHEIEGYTPDIEVQYIHKKDLDYSTTVNNYRKLPDVSEYLVVSTLYAINGTNSDGGILENLKQYYYATGITVNYFGMNLDLVSSGIMRSKRFFFYKGSDTVYPCSETHFRYVVADIYKISQETVDFYRSAYRSRYEGTSFAKGIAPLNGRSIYRNFYSNTTEYNFSKGISFNLMILFFVFMVYLM